MASLCPEDSNKVVYICLKKENSHKYLDDIFKPPDLPDDDQEAWSHL